MCWYGTARWWTPSGSEGRLNGAATNDGLPLQLAVGWWHIKWTSKGETVVWWRRYPKNKLHGARMKWYDIVMKEIHQTEETNGDSFRGCVNLESVGQYLEVELVEWVEEHRVESRTTRSSLKSCHVNHRLAKQMLDLTSEWSWCTELRCSLASCNSGTLLTHQKSYDPFEKAVTEWSHCTSNISQTILRGCLLWSQLLTERKSVLRLDATFFEMAGTRNYDFLVSLQIQRCSAVIADVCLDQAPSHWRFRCRQVMLPATVQRGFLHPILYHDHRYRL